MTSSKTVAPITAVLCYTIAVLSGRRKPIPIDTTKRCKAIVYRNVGSFCCDDTDAEVCAHVRAPLSVFHNRHPTASVEIGERPFPFSDGCDVAGRTKVESNMKFPFTVYTAHHGYDWSNIPDGFSEGSLKKLEQIVTASKPEYMNDGERFEGIIYAQAHLVVFSAMRVPNWDYSNRTSLYYAFAFLPRLECKKVNIDLLLKNDAFVRPSKEPAAEVEYIGGPSALAPESIVAEFQSGSPTIQALDFSYCGELLCENGQIAEKWWIFRTIGMATDGSRVVFEKNKFMFASSKPKLDVPTSELGAGAACNMPERRNISLSYSAGDDPLARLEMKFANALKVVRKERESDAAAIRTLADRVGKIIVVLGVVAVVNLLILGFFFVKAGGASRIGKMFHPTSAEKSDAEGGAAATNETKSANGRKGKKPIPDAKKDGSKSGKSKHEETTK